MSRKLVLIHGYSDTGPSFNNWAAKFQARGIDAQQINICNYISLNNEITIPDIAEGLDRAARFTGWTADQEFDAIVHSTGILVIRAWLANNPERRKYLKHLIGLAPATWGSPLAAAGRSWLGAIARGNKQFGPDFLNAGDHILDALELGSKFQWDLSHRDLLGESPLFTTADDSPYVSVFIGNQSYTGIRELINKPGTDGTVRWSGCSLNARKITVNLTKAGAAEFRAQMSPWPASRLSVPMFAVAGKNHTTLLIEPEDDLADTLSDFLKISSADDFDEWLKRTEAWNAPALEEMKKDNHGPHDGWQQFVIRVVDEYGEPVPDYVVDLFSQDPTDLTGDQLKEAGFQDFDLDVHAYKTDSSFRCFHVRLPMNAASGGIGELWMRLIASSGTDLITYQGYTSGSKAITEQSPVVLNITQMTSSGHAKFFYPFVTTLVEIQVNREPLPLTGLTKLMTMNPFQPNR
ncbi:MAG TPA: hypothetical protein VH351_04250 [Bryobacteraceae bacterium]|nr:hypothetical protein [Bryobacteraceae bacterium]